MRERIERIIGLGLMMAVVLVTVGTVAAQDVSYNAMPGTDFSKFKTYKWVAIEGAAVPDQITGQQIKMAIDRQLSGKGLTKVDGDPADLYVGYQVAVNEEQQWNAYGTGGRPWRWGGGMATATSQTIKVGTIGLDIYDPAASHLVWRGSATKTIDTKASPEKRQKNIDKAMEKLLKNYPSKK